MRTERDRKVRGSLIGGWSKMECLADRAPLIAFEQIYVQFFKSNSFLYFSDKDATWQ